MNQLTRASNLALAALCATLATLAAPAGALAAESTQYTNESLQAFERQLDGGQIASVTVNKRLRSMRTTLKSGEHVLAKYPAHQATATIAELKAKHVPVTVLTTTQAKAEETHKPVHHKIRYIVGGVVIALAVIAGAVLLLRRRGRD